MNRPEQDKIRIRTKMQFFDNAFHRVIICLERLEMYLEIERLNGEKPNLRQTAIGTDRDLHDDVNNKPSLETYFGELQGQCMTLSIQASSASNYLENEEMENTTKYFYKDLLEWYGARADSIPYNEVEASIVPIMLSLNHQSKAKNIDEAFEKYVAKTMSMSDLTDEEQRKAIEDAMKQIMLQMDHTNDYMKKLEELGDLEIQFTTHGRGNAVDGYKRLFDALIKLYDEVVPAKVFVHSIKTYLPEIAALCPAISEEIVDELMEKKLKEKESESNYEPDDTPSQQEQDPQQEQVPQQPNDQGTEKQSENKEAIFIPINGDKYIEDGVEYYKLVAACPTDRAIRAQITSWQHTDEGCNGDLYLGSNGMLLCGKCGKKQKITLCSYIDSVDGNGFSFTDSNVPAFSFIVGLASGMAQKTGVEWLSEFLKNVESTNK